MIQDLDEVLRDLWERLAAGVEDRRAAFRTIQLATLAPDGAPRVRTVVLRGVDASAGRLSIHSDARSEKIAGLVRDARAEAQGYDPDAKAQLRVAGRVVIHGEDAEAEAAWSATAPGARRTYRGPPPGAPLDHPAEGEVEARPTAPDAGRLVFRLLTLEAERLDWLRLAAAGHRRARFVRDGDRWRGRWIAP